jgi:hypothetical protein
MKNHLLCISPATSNVDAVNDLIDQANRMVPLDEFFKTGRKRYHYGWEV